MYDTALCFGIACKFDASILGRLRAIQVLSLGMA